jgi:hypothetical protein
MKSNFVTGEFASAIAALNLFLRADINVLD